MAIRHIVALVTAVLLAPSLVAAEVKLGPETALAELALKPAPVAGPLAVASNGTDFLMAWQDRETGIFVTRVNRNGVPLDPAGRRVATGAAPLLAGSSAGYLIAWKDGTFIHVQHLDENGVPVAPEHTWFSDQQFVAMVSNGTSYLFVYSRANAGTRGVILDADGAVLADVAASLSTSAGVHDGKYVVVTSGEKTLTLHTIAGDGSVVDTALPRAAAAFRTNVTFAPNGILFSWYPNALYSVVGYDGSLIKLPTSLPVNATDRLVASEWDGHEFLLVFQSGAAFRVTADGTLLDTSPFTFSPRTLDDFNVAFNRTDVLAAWTEYFGTSRGAVARVTHDFDALAASHEPATVLSSIAEEQLDAQIARGPGGVFAVWEDASHYEMWAAFNGVSMLVDRAAGKDSVGWPAVAAGDHAFLLVWRHTSENEDRVYFRRYDFDGHAIDPQPITLDLGPNFGVYKNHTFPSIAFGGSAFSVAWSRDSVPIAGTLFTARIGEQGPPSNVQTVPFQFPTVPRSAEAVWTGSEFVLVYTFEFLQLIPEFGPPRMLGLARLDHSNSVLSQSSPTVFDDAGIGSKVAATTFAGRLTVACSSGNGISVAQTALDGTTLRAARVIAQRTFAQKTLEDVSSPDIAWNGSEYVVAWVDWTDGVVRVRAIRLDADLTPIDLAPFEVASEPSAVSDPTLIVTPFGVLIGYSRLDNGTPRAFMRALARVGPESRRRAVR